MPIIDKLVEIASRQHGYVTTQQARRAGIDPHALRHLTAQGRAEHRARGIYRLKAIAPRANDEYAESVLLTESQGAIGGEAALALWELTDVNPRRIRVAVPLRFRTTRPHPGLVFVKWNLGVGDVDEVDDIRVVSPAVAIEMAQTGGLDGSLIEQAISAALARSHIGKRTAAHLLANLDNHQKGLSR